MSQHNTALHRRPVWQTRLALRGLELAAATVPGDLAGNAPCRRSRPPPPQSALISESDLLPGYKRSGRPLGPPSHAEILWGHQYIEDRGSGVWPLSTSRAYKPT